MDKKRKQNKWMDPMFRCKMQSVIGKKTYDKISTALIGRG